MPRTSSPAPWFIIVCVLLVGLDAAPAKAAEICAAPVTQLSCEAPISRTSTAFAPPLEAAPPTAIQLPGVTASAPDPSELPGVTASTLNTMLPALVAQPTSASLTARRLRAIDIELLQREIAVVERLLRQTPRNAHDRPRVLRRLADDHAELASQQRRQTPRRAQRQHRMAIRYYRQLLNHHPQYCRFAGHVDVKQRSCSDEVHRYLAEELKQLGQQDAALKQLERLLSSWPHSRYAADAALALAEARYRAARKDSAQWPQAQLGYAKVLRQPSLSNQMVAYALYKLGHTHWNLTENHQAIHAFARVIDLARQHQRHSATDPAPEPTLVAAAWRELIAVYAQSGDATAAYNFFKALDERADGRHPRTLQRLRRLANASLHISEYARANGVMAVLLKHAQGDNRRCTLHATMARASAAANGLDKAAAVKALGALRQHYLQLPEDTPAPNRRGCREHVLEALGETIVQWHQEALLDHHNARRTSQQLHQWFSALLKERQLAAVDPYDMPPQWLSSTHYAAGELAAANGDYPACARAFRAAGDSALSATRYHHALVGEAGCWLRAAPSAVQSAGELVALARRPARSMSDNDSEPTAAFERFLCAVAPARDDPSARAQHVAIALARAHRYRDHGDLVTAASGYRAIALGHTDEQAGAAAASAYLTSMQVLRALHRPLPCDADLSADAEALHRRLCGEQRSNRRLCRQLVRVKKKRSADE